MCFSTAVTLALRKPLHWSGGVVILHLGNDAVTVPRAKLNCDRCAYLRRLRLSCT